MVVKIVDAIVVIDATVSLNAIFGTQTVLDNKQRPLVAIVQHIEQIIQPNRIDLPAPLRTVQIRVWHHIGNVGTGGVILSLVGGDASAHIIAEGDKIDSFSRSACRSSAV